VLTAVVLASGIARPASALGPQTPSAAAPAQSKFETPRATIEAFLEQYEYQATRDPRARERAMSAFEARTGLAGEEKAGEFADRLAKTFDHVDIVDAERAELELVTLGEKRARWSVTSRVDPTFTIDIGFVRDDERGWVIDNETAAKIYGWYTRAADLPRVAGVADKPLSTTEVVRGLVPKKLKGGGFLLEPWQWIGLLLLFLIAFFFERILTVSVRPLVRKLSRFEGVSLPQNVLVRFERPFGWLLLAWLWLAGVQLLDLPTGVYAPLRIGVDLFTTVMSVWTVYALVEVLCWPLAVKAEKSENKFDDMLVPLLRRTLKLIVLLVGAVFLISRLTGDLWHVLAGLSIGSLAVGFAAKDSIENLFGTFTVLLDGPFKIGDIVKVADFEGVVEEVGFRSTRIRTAEDSLITVPNSRFITSHVDNLGSKRARRVRLVVALECSTPPEKIEAFCEGVRELVRQHPYLANENYFAWLAGFGASSLDVEVICFVQALDFGTYSRERHRLYLDILRLAQRLDVGMAYPTQMVVQAAPRSATRAAANGAQALLEGRAAAREVAERSLASLGGKPPPLRFDPNDPDATGR
jgi:MscS family membrane protein